MTSTLPPGQRPAPLRRFGIPRFAARRPTRILPARIEVGGDVRRRVVVDVADIAATVGRREQVADLHCVTTWTAPGLRWSGFPFAAVLDVLVERSQPDPEVAWLTCVGRDGFRSCLALEDAVDDSVLLADRLDGEPLTLDHGAPLRLVAPRQYGYKSVKHLHRVDFRREYRPGSGGWTEHPRGRVEAEERSRGLPGPAYRLPWRAMVPIVLWELAEQDARWGR